MSTPARKKMNTYLATLSNAKIVECVQDLQKMNHPLRKEIRGNLMQGAYRRSDALYNELCDWCDAHEGFTQAEYEAEELAALRRHLA